MMAACKSCIQSSDPSRVPDVDRSSGASYSRASSVSSGASSATRPSSVPATVRSVLASPGRSLDPASRQAMQTRIGHDFSSVQVHDDALAAASARDIGARAYAFGSHVVFDAAGFSPGGPEGQALLAHELTHVVQQSGAPVGRPSRISSPGDPAEVQARTGRRPSSVQAAPPDTVHRDLNDVVQGIKKISVPTGVRALDAAETKILDPVFGTSLDYSRIKLSNGLGYDGRPFTLYTPGVGTVIQIGAGPYTTPGSDPSLLIHESTHSWQSQHHSNPAQYMSNSVSSQSAAGKVAGGSAYCFIPGKAFSEYGAEQGAQMVERGIPAARSHVSGVAAGAVDPDTVAGLSAPHYEVKGAPGVMC